jgi:flavin reductase (DIM6/NTAB) family NADH-FMN oxidoreductase RutF
MRKPWNATNHAVYSLATVSNMNICTYVTAISMQPKMYAIAIYKNTKTLSNMQQQNFAVLQILQEQQAKLVNVLGKKSGTNYDKINYLHKKNELDYYYNIPVLKNCCAWIYLQKDLCIQSQADHDVYLFKVLAYKQFTEANILTQHYLRDQKIIRA